MNAEDFRLGCLTIHPLSSEVETKTSVERLEPRVMQVLVLLSRKRGEVVTRSQLVDCCWAGRVVGDDAIQRCMARLRRLGETHGGFEIDTITRVGYRLRESTVAAVDSFVSELLEHGRELAVGFGKPGAVRRGIALLEEAVARVPSLAPAWALLAQSQVQYRAREAPEHEVESLRAAIAISVERCLRLDPNNGGALACLAFIEPPMGAFDRQERILERALASSGSADVIAPYSAFCASVGRNREALALAERAWADDPRHQGIANWRAILLWQNGLAKESKEALFQIIETGGLTGPMLGHAAVLAAYDADWEAMDRLLHAANKFLERDHDHGLQSALATVSLLRNPSPASRRQVLHRARDRLAKTGTVSLGTLVLLSHLEMVEDAYALAGQASFADLARGSARLRSADIGFHVLFSPPARRLRQDARFALLCTTLHLGEYWMKSGRWPDCAVQLRPHYDLTATCAAAHQSRAA